MDPEKCSFKEELEKTTKEVCEVCPQKTATASLIPFWLQNYENDNTEVQTKGN